MAQARILYEGIVYPPSLVAKKIDEAREGFRFRCDDVVVATFPKCGTTWCQQIVLLLLNDGRAELVRDPMKMSPWIEKNVSVPGLLSLEDLNNLPIDQRRCLKTHAPIHLVPWKGGLKKGFPAGGKIIVVTRNCLDTAVSLYHHTRDVATFCYTGDWNHFSQLFVDGEVESGNFWEWHAGWWTAYKENTENILWITYEELQADLKSCVKRISNFLGIQATDELIDLTVSASSFSAMKKQFQEVDAEKQEKGLPVKKNHIRKGKSGGWRSAFTKEQLYMFGKQQSDLDDRHNIPWYYDSNVSDPSSSVFPHM